MLNKSFKLRPKAVEDLENIYSYSFRQWGIDRTETYLTTLNQALRTLAENSKMGRNCSEIRPNLYAFNVESHVIFYKPTDYGIAVVRVLHKMMDSKLHV